MTGRLDPRRHAYRADLAAAALRGTVDAPRFVDGTAARVTRAATALRRQPNASLGFDTELLFGETVVVLDTNEDWSWVQADRDGYVGYVPADVLSAEVIPATHKVSSLGTFLYPGPDMKLPPLMHLSINSMLAVAEDGEKFARLSTGGFVFNRHISPVARHCRDFVVVAEQLVGTPYLWGGRTRVGLDCSGLVQTAMHAAGLDCPRDSDMQEAEVGANLLVPDPLDGLARGDLVFWPGHVGIMIDAVMMVHANAFHMETVIEPLTMAARRIDKSGSSIRAVKRPGALSAVPSKTFQSA